MRPAFDNDYSYESFRERFKQILKKFAHSCRDETLFPVIDFIDALDAVKGEPQPDMDWTEEYNIRGGYRAVLPGMLSELISLAHLAGKGTTSEIKIARSKKHQSEDGIDYWVDTVSYQVKTARFRGDPFTYGDVYVDKDWVAGTAEKVALVDIDSHVCVVMDRLALERFVGKRVNLFVLREQGAQAFDNHVLYAQGLQ